MTKYYEQPHGNSDAITLRTHGQGSWVFSSIAALAAAWSVAAYWGYVPKGHQLNDNANTRTTAVPMVASAASAPEAKR